MVTIPQGVRSVLQDWSAEFSESVWSRFQVLMFAAIVCVGRHTVCRLLRIAGTLAGGHWCGYRVWDKSADATQRARFSSSILPPYMRKSRSIEELIPWLYLEGISTGDFSEALQSLIGPAASGFSANVVVRLKEQWSQEYETWSRRDLTGKHYV